jgi:uncharacterized protein (TIGR02996 family)
MPVSDPTTPTVNVSIPLPGTIPRSGRIAAPVAPAPGQVPRAPAQRPEDEPSPTAFILPMLPQGEQRSRHSRPHRRPLRYSREAFMARLRGNPHDMTTRGVAADWIDEHENNSQQTPETELLRDPTRRIAVGTRNRARHYQGEAVTVARDGARMAGRYPIFTTAIYRPVARRDGTVTWRRVDSVRGHETSGYGITRPMIARAREYAESQGLPLIPGLRHGQVANPELEVLPDLDPDRHISPG